MSDSRALVLTTAVGYNAAQCRNFLASLRNSGYTGDIAFFTDDASEDLQALLKEHRVTPVPIQQPMLKRKRTGWYPTLLKLFRNKRLAREKLIEFYYNWLPIPSTRFMAYRKYLKSVSTWYDECFVCDVRDIVFQRNPFETPTTAEITFYEEHKDYKLCNCQYNAPWIVETYGQKALESWGKNTAICSGATHIKGEGIFRYLDLMIDQMVKVNAPTPGTDQAIHNYIAFNIDVPGLEIVRQADAQVLNIGTTPTEEFRFNEEGMLLNQSGQVASVVHQYDRHEAIFAELVSKLSKGAIA